MGPKSLKSKPQILNSAGAAGIGPALKVLETFVLPLYDAPLSAAQALPSHYTMLAKTLLGFVVHGILAAEAAIL